MTTTADLLRPVLDDLAVVVEGTRGHESDPTPCTELDVAGVRHHAASWLANFADGYSDPSGQAAAAGAEVPDDVDGLVDSVRDSTVRLATAVRDGALERELKLGGNGLPGDVALSMILWEYVVHGWDLAAATGQRWAPSDEACEASLQFAPAMLTDEFQGEGKPFGPPVPVPDDAPALDRLLGLSGRDPGWSPAS
ncbi:TIGR03086 family metal-binding protein [Jatrophihabitans sp. YIM 134969]